MLRPITSDEKLPPRVNRTDGGKGFVARGPSVCCIAECEARVVGRGLCNRHWTRWRVYGDPLADHRIKAAPEPIRRERRNAAARIGTAGRRQAARVVVAGIRASTPCAHCGERMADFHSPEHVANPNRRVCRMVGRGVAVESILAEIARCTPLCRRCHMVEDERLGLLPVGGAGEKNGNSKLTWAIVRHIRSVDHPMSPAERREIAHRYGVHETSISHVIHGKTWRES